MKVNIDLTGVIVLTIVFAVLKCAGTLDWSWFWVFSPLWIAFIVIVFLMAAYSIYLWFKG
jgi:hypothetical protein